jgi:biopolymer transport protein ExbB/TolQ
MAEGAPGGIVDCANCDRSFVTPVTPIQGRLDAPDTSGSGEVPPPGTALLLPAALPGTAAERTARRGPPTDPRLATTGLLAIGLTVLFYGAVVWPLSESTFGQLFGNRGWVPYVISYLSIWSLALLAGKYRRLSRQTRVLQLDLLPRSIGAKITPENAPAFLSYLRSLPAEFSDNFLVERVSRALEHFCARSRVSETVDQLHGQSESDEAQVESSYLMVRVFIWAIPILGFIGTVMGIGASVGGFSATVSDAADLEVMKDSIGAVTQGLGVAFDTTLLALVMSIFIMFPTSSLQKAEEEFLAQIEDYCRKHLIGRLDDPELDAAGEGNEAMQRAVDRLADALITRLERPPTKVH